MRGGGANYHKSNLQVLNTTFYEHFRRQKFSFRAAHGERERKTTNLIRTSNVAKNDKTANKSTKLRDITYNASNWIVNLVSLKIPLRNSLKSGCASLAASDAKRASLPHSGRYNTSNTAQSYKKTFISSIIVRKEHT